MARHIGPAISGVAGEGYFFAAGFVFFAGALTVAFESAFGLTATGATVVFNAVR